MKIVVCITLLTIALTVSQGLASDICSLGKEALLLPESGREEFYKKNIEGKVLQGKGVVMRVWKRGPNENYTVSIDCGNDVVVNLTTTVDVMHLKAGQHVHFEGTCVSYGNRRYVYSKETYTVFELYKGSVDETNHK